MENEIMNQLETLIDQNSLKQILDQISQICFKKFGHIELNYQDYILAQKWKIAGRKIGIISHNLDI